MDDSLRINIIPVPKEVRIFSEGYTYFPATVGECVFEGAVTAFKSYAARLGIYFVWAPAPAVVTETDETLPSGAYTVSITNGKAVLAASDISGMNHAFSALLQMMRKNGVGVDLPLCFISDRPDCSYRGLMVDIGRVGHEFSYLLKYVDLCWFYRLGVFHLHLTDNQNYMFPSKKYPGLNKQGKYFTSDEIAYLNEYARERGVELMPEIDVPGHSKCFGNAYPEIFGSNGIISQDETSVNAVSELFGEVCDMFPYSEYVHIGGDEAEIGKWAESEKCVEYAKANGLYDEDKRMLSEKLYAHFVETMAETVKAKGKTAVAWEGFSPEVNDLMSKDILMMSWENYYQTTPSLLSAGFKILNCSWNPLYVVAPDIGWKENEVYDWTIYRWKPVHGKSPYIKTGLEIAPDENVLGGELLAWGDRIVGLGDNAPDGTEKELSMISERLPYVSENTWNVKKRFSFDEICKIASAQREKASLLLR